MWHRLLPRTGSANVSIMSRRHVSTMISKATGTSAAASSQHVCCAVAPSHPRHHQLQQQRTILNWMTNYPDNVRVFYAISWHIYLFIPLLPRWIIDVYSNHYFFLANLVFFFQYIYIYDASNLFFFMSYMMMMMNSIFMYILLCCVFRLWK
jgi:hypothetical protein